MSLRNAELKMRAQKEQRQDPFIAAMLVFKLIDLLPNENQLAQTVDTV